MKRYLFLLLVISSIMQGQSQPIVIDNSAYFPPVMTQYWNSCGVVSLVYYLKSAIWNKQFNRNPSLLENQFSPYTPWNLTVYTAHYSTDESAVYLMSDQGCPTVDKFPLEVDQESFPSLAIRESGLRFRSIRLNRIRNSFADSTTTLNYIAALKDSLRKGICFTLHLPIFKKLTEMYNVQRAVYDCYPAMSQDSILGSHNAAVVGYDDTIKTAYGRGAFKIINSWGKDFGQNGYFYYDYNWFFWGNWLCHDAAFLEENFEYKPEITLSFKLSRAVTGTDIDQRRYFITDTVYVKNDRRIDYENYEDFYFHNHTLMLHKYNGQIVPAENQGHFVNNDILVPLHNHDGNREIIHDLTSLVANTSFKSLEVIANDPISGQYIGSDGRVLYSFDRQPKMAMNLAIIKFLGSGRHIQGKVKVIGDTTVTTYNFYSDPVQFHVVPYSNDAPFVKKGVSTFRRLLVTFSIEDSTSNQPPEFVTVPGDSITAYKDSLVSFQFNAVDPEGGDVKYFVSGESGAQIDSISGLFTFKSDVIGKHLFAVTVTDGSDSAVDSFQIIVQNTLGVKEDKIIPSVYKLEQNFPNPFNPATTIRFSLAKACFTSLKVYDILGREVTTLVNGVLSSGPHDITFNAGELGSGLYIYKLQTPEYSYSRKMSLLK